MGKLSKSLLKIGKKEKSEDDFYAGFDEHTLRVVMENSESCKDVEFIMRALELDRCPYCLAYYDEDGKIYHTGGTH